MITEPNTKTKEEALIYFAKMPPITNEDGSLNYEAMAGELLAEGAPFAEVSPYMKALALA
jgi:hypothetical protein